MPSVVKHIYEFGDFRLDEQNRVLWRSQESVPLTPKTLDMLLVLVQRGGEVIPKDELMNAVWPDSFVEEANLTQTVFMLRKVLGETPDRRYILTMQGRGYRFALDVKEISGNEHIAADAPVVAPVYGAADASTWPATSSGQALVRPTRTAEPGTAQADHHLEKRLWVVITGTLGILLIAVFAGYLRWWAAGTQTQEPRPRMMLAVLPFQNLTGDAGQEYFSDGTTEEMISQMGNLDPQHLGVIARTSVMHYKNGQPPLDQIGRELGVQFVLEGSVRRDADKVRITAQLIQMRDQSHLWARDYDRELSHMLALQSEIAQEIASEIQLTLGEDKSAISASQPHLAPNSYEAYDFYLKGRYFWNKRTTAGFKEAIKYFQQAIAKDPDYARAYAGLADCYALLPGYSYSTN